jgi:hypothetical protein
MTKHAAGAFADSANLKETIAHDAIHPGTVWMVFVLHFRTIPIFTGAQNGYGAPVRAGTTRFSSMEDT